MKRLLPIAVASVLLSPGFCANERLTVQDIADTSLAEENEKALNENFKTLWLTKTNSDPEIKGGQPAFLVIDLASQDKATENAIAINKNLDDLYEKKVSSSGLTSSTSLNTWWVEDILDESKSDENTYKINQAFFELFTQKKDD